jgi:NADPH:quinone reductase-like Zn-dependent oxidoreductase
MKAIGVNRQDSTPRLFDIDEPVAAPDGVVVEVMAASVNDFDRAAVDGRNLEPAGRTDPVMLGRDFVGRVVSVGDDVDYIDVGMYVAGALPPRADQPGTFADRVAVPAHVLAPVPDGLGIVQAAAIGLAGITALDASAAPNGHKLADLLFKAVSHGRRNQELRTYSFEQVADAIHDGDASPDSRAILVR